MPEKKKAGKPRKPGRKQAEEAIRTLLLWAGEDPRREGLVDTPKRVVSAYEDWLQLFAASSWLIANIAAIAKDQSK